MLGYVRPQVDWLNSAWWQWGAWSEVFFVDWLNQIRPIAEWGRLMAEWKNIPWIGEVNVRLLQGDVVQDFMKTLGYEIPAQPRVNQSLPGTLLRLFQRNRQLRRGPHDVAIEFVLARHLEFEGGKTPWVIRPRLVEELVAYYRNDNEKLVEMLPPEMRETMLADQRWWSAEAYANKRFVHPREEAIDYEEMERLLVASLEAIKKLDARVRKLGREADDSLLLRGQTAKCLGSD